MDTIAIYSSSVGIIRPQVKKGLAPLQEHLACLRHQNQHGGAFPATATAVGGSPVWEKIEKIDTLKHNNISLNIVGTVGKEWIKEITKIFGIFFQNFFTIIISLMKIVKSSSLVILLCNLAKVSGTKLTKNPIIIKSDCMNVIDAISIFS